MAIADSEMPTVCDGVKEIKYQFLHLSVHPPWLSFRPLLLVNTLCQISYDGSDWHGSAIYRYTDNGGVWAMTYNWQADVNEMKTVLFEQVKGTNVFLHLLKGFQEFHNALLIPYYDHADYDIVNSTV